MANEILVTGKKYNRNVKLVLGMLLLSVAVVVLAVMGFFPTIITPVADKVPVAIVSEVSDRTISESVFEKPILMAVLRKDGAYSFAKIENAALVENQYVSEVELTYQNGDSGLVTEKNGVVDVFISKQTGEQEAFLLDRGVTGVTLPDKTILPVRLVTGRVVRGKIVGEFELLTLTDNKTITGKFDTRGKLTNIKVVNSLSEPDVTRTQISKELLRLSEVLQGRGESHVLGLSTDGPSVLQASTGAPVAVPIQGVVAAFNQVQRNVEDGSLVVSAQTIPAVGAITPGGVVGPEGPAGPTGPQGPAGDGDITGVAAGDGVQGGGDSGTVSMGVKLTGAGTAGSNQTSSGLEVSSNGLSLLTGCSNGQTLSWNTSLGFWQCSTGSGGGGTINLAGDSGTGSVSAGGTLTFDGTGATTVSVSGSTVTINSSTGSVAFSGITSATNTTAAMVVGTGASLNFSGSGTINASSLGGATFASPTSIGSTTANTGAFTTLSASSTLTASNGLTMTTGALNLTSTSGALTLSGLSASSINTGANALTITSSNFNTTATGINSTNIGATTPGTGAFTTLSSTGLTNLGTTGASNVNIATTGTGNTAIGNATGTFSLTSSGGLNVSTSGALTGVSSIDTIGVSATALTFAGAGTVTSTGANAMNVDGGATGTLNLNGTSTGDILIGGGSASTGCTITNSTGALACTGGITGSNLSGTNTGDVTLAAIGATPNANGASLTGQVLNLQPASVSFGGVVTTGTQSFAGAKTFSNTLTASDGLTLTTGALNLTATSGTLSLSGLSASSISTGANNITFTSGNFNTTATGINSTNIGATTAGTGRFTSIVDTGLAINSAVYTDGTSTLTTTAPTSGTLGYWSRTGTTLSPSTSGDAITTSGNISTSGTGTITSAGTLTASNGLTQTTGALNLTATSGTLSLSGLSASSISTGANGLTFTSSNFNTTATGINSTNVGATTPGTGAFTTLSSTGTTNLGQGTGVVTINSSGALNLTQAASSTWTLNNAANALNIDSNTLSVDALNNRLGIGTNAPSWQYSQVGNLEGNIASIFNANTTNSTTMSVLRLAMGTASTTNNARFIQFYASATNDSDGTGVGRIKLNNNAVQYQSGAADIAEYMVVPAAQSVSAGHIIAASPTGNVKATSSNNVLIGVVSDTAAFVGGATTANETDANSQIVGIAGFVNTYVTGTVAIGDPITISSTAGVGEKATSAGYIIGKAAEAHSGVGPDRIKVSVMPGWYDPSVLATATDVNFGDTTATKTIDIGGVTNSATDTINIATNGTASDAITIGNSNAATTVAITGGDDWSMTGAGALTTVGNISTTGTGAITSAGLLTASNGLTLTTGAINLTGTSGALTLSGLSASSISTGANNITFTSGNFNTTATGINSTVVGATTAAAGTFTTLTANTSITRGADTITDFTGNGLTLSSGALTINLPTATDALSATTSSGSGLEVLTAGLTLLQGCSDGQILKWNETTDVWSCSADNSGGSPSFDLITSGTNTAATMTVGTGGTLTFSGSGVVNASTLGGATFASPTSIGSTVANTGAFTTLSASSTLTASNGLTMTTGALNLTSTSGAISSTGLTGLTQTLSTGTAAITAPTLNLNVAGTGNTAVGNSTGTFSLTSSGGLNVTTGGALTGVASIDTIGTTATSLTFAGAGTIASTTTSAITLDSGTTGAVNIGTGANAKTVTLGTTNTTSTTNIQSGTGGILMTTGPTSSSSQVRIGNSGTATPDLLVLDNGTADPTGVNGGMYYNTTTSKFRCYANGSWGTCGQDKITQTYYQGGVNQAANATTAMFYLTPTNTTAFSVALAGTNEMRMTTSGSFIACSIMNSTAVTAGSVSVHFRKNGADVSATNYCTLDTTNTRSNTSTVAAGTETFAAGDTIGVALVSTGLAPTNAEHFVNFTVQFDAGADLAEQYYTNDETISAGDVVSADSTIYAGVKKSLGVGDKTVMGIVSTQPGLILGQGNGPARGVPVALTGRVPVKVSTEGGPIKTGDYLTTSSTPGVAMKAVKAGIALGMALDNYDGEGVGTVNVYVKNSFVGGESTANKNGFEVFTGLMENINQISSESVNLSELVSDRVTAGLEVITPKVITQDILATGLFIMTDKDGNENVRISSSGDASFSGTLVVDTIKARRIEGMDLITKKLSILTEEVAGVATQSAEVVSEKVVTEMNILDMIAKAIEGVFKNTAEFLGKVIFRNEVFFAGRPTFNKDTAGFALMKSGSNEVEVKFDKEYKNEPIVNISLNIVGEVNINDLPKYAIADVNTKGFKIRMAQPLSMDLRFSWMAMAVDSVSKFESNGGVVLPASTVSEPVVTPSVTPFVTPESTESAVIEVIPTPSVEITPMVAPEPTVEVTVTPEVITPTVEIIPEPTPAETN